MKKISLRIFSNKAVAAFRKSTVGTLCIIVAFLFILGAGCDNEEENETGEISLTNCQWVNLNFDDSVIVINSKTELEKYVTKETLPPIDFSKHTLLLASGVSPRKVELINTSLLNCSATKYELQVTVYDNSRIITENWYISIIVPKISDIAEVNLKTDFVQIGPAHYRENLIGKWELIRITTFPVDYYQNRKEIDCSEKNIVFDFQTDATLVITGGSVENNFPKGKHVYNYGIPVMGILVTYGPNMEIDGERMYCYFSEDKNIMIINQETDVMSYLLKIIK
jgi:hypothetical protein